MTKVMSRRTLREPMTSSSPPTTQTGKISVSDTMMPCRPPMASDIAPMSTDPAKPPKTSEYTPNMAKQMVRISGGAVAASVRKMQMARGDTAALARNWRTTTIQSLGT